MPKRRRLSCSNQKKKRTKQVRPISKDGHWEIERVVDVSAASTVPTSNLNINERQHWVCLVDWKGNDFVQFVPSWEPAGNLTESAWKEAQTLLILMQQAKEAEALLKPQAAVESGGDKEEQEEEAAEGAKPAAITAGEVSASTATVEDTDMRLQLDEGEQGEEDEDEEVQQQQQQLQLALRHPKDDDDDNEKEDTRDEKCKGSTGRMENCILM